MKQRILEYCCAGIGELLWDVLPESETLGGAPVNFAYHVNALGARGIPISTVGPDRRGFAARAELETNGIETAAITKCDACPTGFVNARIDAQGIATYHFPDDVAWDHLHINTFAAELRHDLDAVCYGSLAMRSKMSQEAILEYLDSLPQRCLRVFDVNLRQDFYSDEVLDAGLQRADIVKLNDDELRVLTSLKKLPRDEEAGLKALLELYHPALVILTRGERGSIVMSADSSSIHPGIACDVIDTIGAGDAFTAMATLCYLNGLNLDEINGRANRLAAHVCSRQGAMVPPPDNFRL